MIQFSPEIKSIISQILNYANTPTSSNIPSPSTSSISWAIFTLDKTETVKLCDSGSDVSEMLQEFSQGHIQYSFSRIIEPISNLPKFLLISWCGEGVPVSRKGLFHQYQSSITSFFTGYHVHIQARSEDDITLDTVMQKIKTASGAKYGIHENPISGSNFSSEPSQPSLLEGNLKINTFNSKSTSEKPSSPASNLKFNKQNIQTNNSPSSKTTYSPAYNSSFNKTYSPTYNSFNKPNSPASSTFNKPQQISSQTSNYVQAQIKSTEKQQLELERERIEIEKQRQILAQQKEEIENERVRIEEMARKIAQVQIAEKNKEQERLAAEKRDQERIAAEKRDQERIAAEKRDQERIAAEKRDQERIAAEKREHERLAAERRVHEQKEKDAIHQENQQLEFNGNQIDSEQNSSPNQEENNISAIVIYDYQKDEQNEINLVEGEIIYNVVEQEGGWCYGKKSNGEHGYFPGNYIEIQSPVIKTMKTVTAIALYDYDAAEENEITFKEGDIITDITYTSDTWWHGCVNGQWGVFPGNYTEIQ